MCVTSDSPSQDADCDNVPAAGHFAKNESSGAGANPRHSRLEREPLLRPPPVTSPVRAVSTLFAEADPTLSRALALFTGHEEARAGDTGSRWGAGNRAASASPAGGLQC